MQEQKPLRTVTDRFVWRRLLRMGPGGAAAAMILSGGGMGFSPWLPGTMGTLVAWAIVAAFPGVAAWGWLAAGAAALAVGIPLVAWAQRRLDIEDPGWIVIDEIAAFWLLTAVVVPANGLEEAILFILFRACDMAKPWPVRWIERRWAGAAGVMADDLAAAMQAALLAWILRAAFGGTVA